MRQYEEEKNTVELFLKNQEINYKKFALYKGREEPCDIYCPDTAQQFQITWNRHDFQYKIKKQKIVESCIKIDDALDIFIVDPIRKKMIYGKSAKDIILLIKSPTKFPFGNNHLEKAKKEILSLKNNYFEEIYLVCPKYNIKLY